MLIRLFRAHGSPWSDNHEPNLYRGLQAPQRNKSMKNKVMATVTIGRSQQITFSEPIRDSEGGVTDVLVIVELPGLRGHRQVAAHYTSGFQELAQFFEDLAEHWTGWPGTKTYRSLEGDLQLTASHTGSHIELGFTLQDPEFSETWSLRGRLTLDAGEELSRAADELKTLLN